jgi:hypothetical protein
MNYLRRSFLLGFCLLGWTVTAHAEIITIDGTVKSVDAKKRTITVESGTKTRSFDVSSKAKVSIDGEDSGLDGLKEGQTVSLSYHDQLEVVVKIEVVSDDGEKAISLFDGKTLNGWTGDKKYWKVEDGAIVGTKPSKLQGGTFLASTETFDNFVLKAKFKLTDGNSGIQFRSQRLAKHQMSGYQADIAYHDDDKFLGWLTGEGMAQGVIAQTTPHQQKQVAQAIDRDGWNEYVITANGDRMTLEINGVKTVDVHHDGPLSGAIGFQLHAAGSTTVAFKDITIEKLP